MSISYEELNRWKYRLVSAYTFKVGLKEALRPATRVGLQTRELQDIVTYDPESDLCTIRSGFCWDGPSGPTIDTVTSLRPSLTHDALYQLMRLGHLSPKCRQRADELYRDLLIENGVSTLRAYTHYYTLRLAGGFAAQKGTQPKTVKVAP
jgi:hypothetical protein